MMLVMYEVLQQGMLPDEVRATLAPTQQRMHMLITDPDLV